MKIGIMQPYFMPYIGYFQLINAVDKYVVYDDVNYIKGGWVNRNNILMNGACKQFSVMLKAASPNKLFNEIEILDDFTKFEKTLQACYAKAPYYQNAMTVLRGIFSYPDRNLARFLMNSLQEIAEYLNIDTEFRLSSGLDKDNTLKGQAKVISICKRLHADTYINAIGGKALYNKDEFRSNGIDLKFLKTAEITYSQFKNTFIPNLSIIDVMMFNSPEKINIFLNQYELA